MHIYIYPRGRYVFIHRDFNVYGCHRWYTLRQRHASNKCGMRESFLMLRNHESRLKNHESRLKNREFRLKDDEFRLKDEWMMDKWKHTIQGDGFTPLESLIFGALISATDPVTVLPIFEKPPVDDFRLKNADEKHWCSPLEMIRFLLKTAWFPIQ